MKQCDAPKNGDDTYIYEHHHRDGEGNDVQMGNGGKTFVSGAQRGPFTVAQLAAQAACGALDAGTRAWDMRWDPTTGKWQTAGDVPMLAGLFGAAIPDPDDSIPDPD